MGRWARPYPRSLATVAADGTGVVFAAGAVATAVIAVGGLVAGDFAAAGGAGAAAALTALVAGVTFRAVRCGVFVSAADGVMIRRFGDTTAWPWTRVSAIESRPARLRTFGIAAGDETMWLVLADGAAVETPLRSIDADDYSRWHQQDGMVWLDRSDYAVALWTMRDLHRAVTARPVAGREDTAG